MGLLIKTAKKENPQALNNKDTNMAIPGKNQRYRDLLCKPAKRKAQIKARAKKSESPRLKKIFLYISKEKRLCNPCGTGWRLELFNAFTKRFTCQD